MFQLRAFLPGYKHTFKKINHTTVTSFLLIILGMCYSYLDIKLNWEIVNIFCIDYLEIHHLFYDDSLRGAEDSSQRPKSLPQVQFLFFLKAEEQKLLLTSLKLLQIYSPKIYSTWRQCYKTGFERIKSYPRVWDMKLNISAYKLWVQLLAN